MVRRLNDTEQRSFTFTFDGNGIEALPGDSIAAALLAADVADLRETSVSGSPRGPFCMMGACYDCLVEIDGETVQACMTPAGEGLNVMRVRRPDDD